MFLGVGEKVWGKGGWVSDFFKGIQIYNIFFFLGGGRGARVSDFFTKILNEIFFFCVCVFFCVCFFFPGGGAGGGGGLE